MMFPLVRDLALEGIPVFVVLPRVGFFPPGVLRLAGGPGM